MGASRTEPWWCSFAVKPWCTLGENHWCTYGRKLTDSGSVTLNGFGFAGEQVDPETGFVYLRNRSYDPTTSRFLTPDPLGYAGSGVNLYAYVGNNPATLTDPSGLACPECPGSGGVGGGGGGLSSSGGGGGFEPPVVPPAPEGGYPEDFIGPVLPAEPPVGAGAFGPAGEGGTFCPETEGAGNGSGREGNGGAGEASQLPAGFTSHGWDQALNRDGVGVSDAAMQEALTHQGIPNPQRGSIVYTGEHAAVILNEDGDIITTWATDREGWRHPPTGSSPAN